LGVVVGGVVVGGFVLGVGAPHPKPQNPNPQSPIPNPHQRYYLIFQLLFKNYKYKILYN